MLRTPITGSGDKQFLIPSTVPIAAAMAVSVLQAHTTNSFSECKFPPAVAAKGEEQQR
jgi:hypothetical protein